MAEKLNSNIFASFKNIKDNDQNDKEENVLDQEAKIPVETLAEPVEVEKPMLEAIEEPEEKPMDSKAPEEKVIPSIALNIFDKKPPRKTNVTSITLTDKASENWKRLAGQYGVSKNEFINQLLESLIEE